MKRAKRQAYATYACMVPGGPAIDHNCVKVRRWLRTRWVCVRCGEVFKEDTR